MPLTRRTALQRLLASSLVGQARTGVAQPTRAAARTLRFVPEFNLLSLDPIVNTAYTTLQHSYMIYDTLFAMDASFSPRPQMVETFTISDDGCVYQFRLRPGLRFHDGAPVLARDCVASIRRWAARDVMGRLLLARTLEIAAIDESRFRLRLSDPFPLALHALAKISASPCVMMREKDAATDPFQAVAEPIGSGPFRFLPDEHRPGSLVAYAAYAEYVPRADPSSGYAGAKRAGVARVEWRIIPDAATQVVAIRAGEVDIIASPPPELLPQLRRDPALRVASFDQQGWLLYIRPNHIHPPFDDVRARRALMHLVDQRDFMAAAGGADTSHPCMAFMSCGPSVPGAAGMEQYGQPDLGRARALLAEAGYAGEPIVVLHPVDNPSLGGTAMLVMAQLRKIGVTVAPLSADLATVLSLRASQKPPGSGGWHLLPGRSLGIELASPLTNFPLASPCGRSAGGERDGWFGWPCDLVVEGLRAEWADAPDDAERSRIAGLLQQRAALSLPFIPVGQILTPLIHRRAVTGLIEMPVPVLWNATESGAETG